MRKSLVPFGIMFSLLIAAIIFTVKVVAQDATPPAEVDVLTFFAQVSDLIKAWGGYEWMGKVAAVITVLVSATKVSFIRPLWDKLGDLKIWVAPVLGLIAGVLMLGKDMSWAGVFAYISAGAGAVFIHEILDLVKKIPGIGSIWTSIISVIEIILKKPDPLK